MPTKYAPPSRPAPPSFETRDAAPRRPAGQAPGNVLDALAPARDNTADYNLGDALGKAFGLINRLAERAGHEPIDPLRPGTWTPPAWDQSAFEAQCYAMMRPDAADHLIAHVAKARASSAFENAEARREVEARLKREQEEAAARTRVRHLLAESGMPDAFQRATFACRPDGKPLQVHEGNARAFRLCVRLVEEWQLRHKGLTLSGPDSGCGKSLLCACVAVALIEKNLRVVWVTASELLALNRKSFGATWEKNPGVLSGEQLWQRYAVRPGLLVLDDLGAEKVATGEAGDWAREKFLELIDHRHEGQKTTLVTTNLTEAELRDKYGARIVSRLLSRSPLIRVTGPDYRQDVMPDAEDPFAE